MSVLNILKNKIASSLMVVLFVISVETTESEEVKPAEEPKKEPAMVA